MTTTTLPSWDNLRRDYLDPGLPHRLVLGASPAMHVFTDTGAARLGARFEMPPSAPASEASVLEQILVADVSVDAKRYLEVSTTSRGLYESFYRLIAQIVEAISAGIDPAAALAQAVSLWETLLERAAVLSEERQAGLFGELLFLERLILAGTPDAVRAWVGPDRQAHDFRCGTVEFEIKTTSGAKRVHTINGLGQLQASADCSLYLLSLQTTDAGTGGRCLPDLVDGLRGLLPEGDMKDFEARLQAAGYVERHRAHYGRRRRLRSDMLLIPVQDGMPRLIPEALGTLPSRFAPERIGNVVYDVDVTGLGHADGSPAFLAIVPPAQGVS